jgi:hypothetical protein
MQFVELDEHGTVYPAGYAPYLDYRPLTEEEQALVAPLLDAVWLQHDLEQQALGYAIEHLVPNHFQEVQQRQEERIAKTLAAVKERLTKEIIYWDHRAEELRLQEQAGKTPRLNSTKARQRADELQARLQRRTEELEQERRIAPLPPVVIGGALVVPGGLLARLQGTRQDDAATFARETQRVERLAMAAVAATEQRLGYEPRDVSRAHVGYDIESAIPGSGRLRFIEVKGRIAGSRTVTLTKNEILTALNKPDDWLLALVEVPPAPDFAEGDAFATGVAEERAAYDVPEGCRVRYVQHPFSREPDFGAVSVNYDWRELWERGQEL